MLTDRFLKQRRPRRAGLAAALSVMLALASLQPALAALMPRAESTTPVFVRFEGYVKLMEANRWLIGAHSVTVGSGTVVIEKHGRAEAGAWVIVEGEKDEADVITANFVTVQRPAGQGGPLQQFSGTVKKQLDDLWVIDDKVVRITTDTRITNLPAVGWLVWVVTEEQADRLDPVALAIEGLASRPALLPVEFEGVLDSVTPEWSVDGRPFVLDAQAVMIGGTPEVGARVELQATVAPDGALTVNLMRVVDTSADARLNALVAAITTEPNGEQLWDIVAFSDQPYGEPLAGVLHVGANSLVDESRAVVHPGLWAEVQGITISRDEFEADVVRLEEPTPTSVTGEIVAAGAGAASGWYTVKGQSVWIAPSQRSRLAAVLEGHVIVRGVRLGNGVVLAQRITPVDSSAR